MHIPIQHYLTYVNPFARAGQAEYDSAQEEIEVLRKNLAETEATCLDLGSSNEKLTEELETKIPAYQKYAQHIMKPNQP